VEANAAGRVTFTNAMRTGAQNASFFRRQAGEIGRLKLSLAGAGKYNETLIAFAADATEAADRRYDARKMQGNAGLSLFSLLEDEDYAIQALPLLTGPRAVPLGTAAGAAGRYSVSVAALENLAADVTILLEDKQTGLFHDLRQQTTVAVQLEAGRRTDRFVLHFGTTPLTAKPMIPPPAALPAGTTPDPAQPAAQPQVPLVVPVAGGTDPVSIFTVRRTIFVRLADPAVAEVSGALFNLRGEKVEDFTAAPVVNGRAELPTHVRQQQVYIFRLSAGGSVVSKRLYLGQ
jgi:hypothetical protein